MSPQRHPLFWSLVASVVFSAAGCECLCGRRAVETVELGCLEAKVSAVELSRLRDTLKWNTVAKTAGEPLSTDGYKILLDLKDRGTLVIWFQKREGEITDADLAAAAERVELTVSPDCQHLAYRVSEAYDFDALHLLPKGPAFASAHSFHFAKALPTELDWKKLPAALKIALALIHADPGDLPNDLYAAALAQDVGGPLDVAILAEFPREVRLQSYLLKRIESHQSPKFEAQVRTRLSDTKTSWEHAAPLLLAMKDQGAIDEGLVLLLGQLGQAGGGSQAVQDLLRENISRGSDAVKAQAREVAKTSTDSFGAAAITCALDKVDCPKRTYSGGDGD